MHFQNRSFGHACHARDEQKLEETDELMKLVLLSSSPVHFKVLRPVDTHVIVKLDQMNWAVSRFHEYHLKEED